MQQGPGPAAGEERDAGVRSLIDVNGLAYRMTPGMSVATSRITREWDALRPVYAPGDVLSFAISSGAAYVDPDNSYIKFQVQIAVPPAPVSGAVKTQQPYYRFYWGEDTEGRQTALNLFQDMRLTHSSGYEIDRINRGFAAYKYIELAYTKDKQWWDTYGSLMRGMQVQTGTIDANGAMTADSVLAHPLFFGADGGRGGTPDTYYFSNKVGGTTSQGLGGPINQNGRNVPVDDSMLRPVQNAGAYTGVATSFSSHFTNTCTGFGGDNRGFGFRPTW